MFVHFNRIHERDRRTNGHRMKAPPSPILAVLNVTAHPSTASVPTSYYSM